MNMTKLKIRIIEVKHREDFTNYLAEILNISPATASKKLNGKVKFSLDDVKTIAADLELTVDEVSEIFLGGIE